MPVLSPRRYSTTTGSSSLLPPSGNTYRSSYSSSTTTTTTSDRFSTDYSPSSYLANRPSYRSSYTSRSSSNLGNDTSASASSSSPKYGVSKYRSSADRDLPPTGSRVSRGDSRNRDSNSVNNSSSSRYSATAGADFYEKYSPSNYTPKCELARSRSLSEAGKLSTSASLSAVSSAKEKTTPTRDILNRSSSPLSSSSLGKVKSCAPNNNNTSSSINHNNSIIFNNNNNTSNNNNNNSVTNNQAFGLKQTKIHSATTTTATAGSDACIAKTNAATIFFDSIKNKSSSTSAVAAAADGPSGIMTTLNSNNNTATMLNGSDRTGVSATTTMSPQTNGVINMKSSNNFHHYSRGSSAAAATTGAKMTNGSSSAPNLYSSHHPIKSKEFLKNECEILLQQLTKSKTNEINNNTSSSSSNSNCSNNHHNHAHHHNGIIGNNKLTNNNLSNGISKLSSGMKNPLVSKNSPSYTSRQSNVHQQMNNGGKSELELVTSKVLNKKFHNKLLPSSNSPTPNIYQTKIQTTATNGGSPINKPLHKLSSKQNSFDEIKFIDSDEAAAERSASVTTKYLNGGGSSTVVNIVPSSSTHMPSTSSASSSSSSSTKSVPLPQPNKKHSFNDTKYPYNGITSKYNSSLNDLKTPNAILKPLKPILSTAPITTTTANATKDIKIINHKIEIEGDDVITGGGEKSRSQSPAALARISSLATTTTASCQNEVFATTTKQLSHDKDSENDSIRNASIRTTLPSSSTSLSTTPTSKYWDRDRSSITSRTLTDLDNFTPSKPSYSASSSYTESPSETTEGLCGLRNIGNTCFMNSVLQCLCHSNDLVKFVQTQSAPKSSTKDQKIFAEFVKLIKEMWAANTRSVTPLDLKSAISSKYRMYGGSTQQDSQEFLRFFLDTLHMACNNGVKGEKLEIDDNTSDMKKADLTWEWYSRAENSVIKDLFVGQFKSSLKCTVCGNTSVTFDPFWDLSVPLPSSSRCKLENCLELFIKEEVLDGDEMPTCSKCATRRKCTKSFAIQRFPKYLVIHLKRFSETRWSKMTNIVEFPTGERELNMAPYASPTNTSSSTYSLYGISNHMGSTAGGHYVALCKHPKLKKWYEFNDNIVSDATDCNLVSSSAYLLFYERS